MRFAELCEESEYDKSEVPEEVQMAFDEKLEQIGQEVDERMRSGVKELNSELTSEISPESTAKKTGTHLIKEINSWSW